MRKAKLLLLIAVTTASFFSLRNKEIILNAPTAKPLVAEAYHAPKAVPEAVYQLGVQGNAPIMLPRARPVASGRSSMQTDSAGGRDADSLLSLLDAARNSNPDNGESTPSAETPVPTNGTAPASQPAPANVVYYGLGSIVSPETVSGTGAATEPFQSNSSSGSGTSDTSPPTSEPNPEPQEENPVFVTDMTPSSGISGSSVLVQGAGFSSTASNNAVSFGGTQAASVSFIAANQLRALIPQGLSFGLLDLSVTVNGVTSNTITFDALKNTASQIFTEKTGELLPAGISPADSSLLKPADADKDRDVDILIVDRVSERYYMLINNGGGAFADETAARLPAPYNVSLITDAVFGDIDNDGDQDIILTYSAGQSARLFLNNGSGVYADATSTNLPAVTGYATSLDLGDVNGDGDLDIIIANKDVKDALLVNNGSGVFTRDINFNLPLVIDSSSDVLFSDIDSDGDLDIITANDDVVGASSLKSRVYINNGAGQFTDATETRIPESADYSYALEAGDLDRDNDIDIITANYNQNSVLINNSIGVFEDMASSYIPANSFISNDAKLGDMDGDGDLDIIFLGNNNISLLLNDGAGYFHEASIKIPDYTSVPASIGGKHVELADIDSDGDLDILIGGGAIRILVNSSENKPPVLDPIGNKTVEAGTSLQFSVSASDPNDDPIVYLAGNLPTGATFSSNIFRWTPAPGDVGLYRNVRFTAKEDTADALQDSEDIAITVTSGDLPVIEYYTPAEHNLVLELGEFVQFGIRAHSPIPGDLTFRWIVNGVEVPGEGDATSSGILIVPEEGDSTVSVTVTNSAGSVPVNWNLIVNETGENNPPEITSYTPLESDITVDLTYDDLVDFSVTASDPDGDQISYSWSFDGNELSTEAALDSSAYSSYATVGDHAVELVVSDEHSATAARGWTLHIAQTTSAEEREALEEVIKHVFQYFWEEAGPSTGLVRDRLLANEPDPSIDAHYEKASMAATGFGLLGMCVAAEKYGDGQDPDWQVTPAELASRVELILDTLLDIQASQAPSGDFIWGKDGFFYHFVNIDTGERWNGSEVSSIDTAIVVAGAITAGEYFKVIDPDISTKAQAVYANVNWNSFIDTTPGGHYGQLYKKWMPDGSAYNGGHWDYSDEGILLYLLAIGSPSAQYAIDEDYYYSFVREMGSYGQEGKPLIQTWFGSLFAYQYVNAFFDLKDMHDSRNISWWQNSVDATVANRQFCIDQGAAYGYNEDVWGLSSAYGEGAIYIGELGAPPLKNSVGPTHDGTVNPSVMVSAVGMLADEVGQTLLSMKSDPDLWIEGQYGFVDSFKNSSPRVYSDYFVGLDLGASLAMASNHIDSGLVHNNFMNAQTRYGTMNDLLAHLDFRANSDPKIYLDVDDISAKGQFSYGLIDSIHTSSQVSFSLADVETDSKYILAIHTFMNNFAGSYQVTAAVNVNGNTISSETFLHTEGLEDEIKYVEIESSNLNVGENIVSITWQSGASWLAWKNVEISSPILTNEWEIIRTEYANEYRLDDTYYAGHALVGEEGEAYKTFEQALNSATDPYTDIIFYMNDLRHERILGLERLYSDNTVYVDIIVNGQLLADNVNMNSIQELTIPVDSLRDGWNRIRLKIDSSGGEWIIWNRLALALGNEVGIGVPQAFSLASFGADKVNLRWSKVNGSNMRYNLYRSPTSGGPFTKINSSPISATQYQDISLQDRTVYYYTVTAFEAADPLEESAPSDETMVMTGDYEVDYGDGKEPNAFGGASSAHFSYAQDIRYDWSVGNVRRLDLDPGQTGIIGLNETNISGSTALSIWIKGNGTESIDIGLKSAYSTESAVTVTVASGWQNLIINLSDFSGISLADIDTLSVKSNGASAITLYMDEITFVREELGAYSLEVKARNVSDNSLSTGVSFANLPTSEYAAANQYLEVKYNSSAQNWKIWVYTRNESGDPQYLGDQFNGLMSSDGRRRVPLIWRIYPGVQQGGVPCNTEGDVYSGTSLTWNYIKDKLDGDWDSANQPGQEYSVICYGGDSWAHLAEVPPGSGERDPVDSTFFVYVGGMFKYGSVGEYSTTVYFDLTHE